jgi:hypothetical protein
LLASACASACRFSLVKVLQAPCSADGSACSPNKTTWESLPQVADPSLQPTRTADCFPAPGGGGWPTSNSVGLAFYRG